MKTSDIVWVQSQAARYFQEKPQSQGSLLSKQFQVPSPAQATNVFVDELHGLMESYARYFNELVGNEFPEARCLVFRAATARPGFMLLRGKDKLVVLADQGFVHVKVLNVQAYQEHSIDQFYFELQQNNQNMQVWIHHEDRSPVNVEMVGREYLGSFFVSGAQGFGAEKRRSNRVTTTTTSHPVHSS